MKLPALLFLFSVLLTNSVFASPTSRLEDTIPNGSHQNLVQKKSITLGILSTHFFHKNDNSGIESNIQFLNPGVEALFHYPLNDIASLAIGLSYQYSKIIYGERSLGLKTMMNEVSIPLLLSIKPFRSTIPDMELAGGFYFGQYVSIRNSFQVFEGGKKNYAELFSKDDFIGDVYAAIGKKSIIKKIPIGFDLFFRYRLKEHQVINRTVSRPFFGIKLKYRFNLQ